MGVTDSLSSLAIGLKGAIDIILIIGVLGLVIVILKVIEKEYKIKLELRKKDRNVFYRKELKKIKEMNKHPEKVLERINIVARGFFKEAFNLPYNLEYLELVEDFETIGKKECIIFCKLVSELAYSGEKIDEDKINNLIKLLEKIMENNKILNEEEKIKLRKQKAPIVKITRKRLSNKDEENETIVKKPAITISRARDINHINWKYKLKIMFLRTRGKFPELRKRKIEN